MENKESVDMLWCIEKDETGYLIAAPSYKAVKGALVTACVAKKGVSEILTVEEVLHFPTEEEVKMLELAAGGPCIQAIKIYSLSWSNEETAE